MLADLHDIKLVEVETPEPKHPLESVERARFLLPDLGADLAGLFGDDKQE